MMEAKSVDGGPMIALRNIGRALGCLLCLTAFLSLLSVNDCEEFEPSNVGDSP